VTLAVTVRAIAEAIFVSINKEMPTCGNNIEIVLAEDSHYVHDRKYRDATIAKSVDLIGLG